MSPPPAGAGTIKKLGLRKEKKGVEAVERRARRELAAFLAVQAALYAAFLAMDLAGLGAWGDPVKFLSILLCLAFCLSWTGRGGDRLTAAALVFTAAADLFLLMLGRWYGLGVALFCVFQGLYLVRVCRLTGRGLWLPLRAGLPPLFWLALGWLEGVLPAGKAGEALALGLCALGGAAVYFALAFCLGLGEARLSASLVKQIGKRG